MKKSTSLAMAMGWVFSISVAGSAYAQTVEIGTWAGFRTAAVSFTFDDGPQSDVDVALPLLKKYGYKATFNIVTNWANGGGGTSGMLNWSSVQDIADAGHEIASHSDSHPNGNGVAMPSDEIPTSKGTINKKIKQPYGCITLAYPNCNTPGDAQVLQNYVLGRICNASWGNPDIMGENGPSNWAAVPALMTGTAGTSDFKGNIQKAVNQGGWVAFLTHGFTTGTNGYANYSPTDASAMEEGLQYAKQNDNVIWVAPMGHVTMYIKERNASTVTASTSGNSITVKLTHNIADNISKYDYPLSLRVKNSSNWASVSGTQGGKSIETTIKDGYIYFDAVPNGGDIVISSGGSSTNPTSSSAIGPTSSNSSTGVPAEYKIEMEKYDEGGQGLTYNDIDGKNGNTGYRTDDAGVVKAGDNGYGIGYTMAGEWYNYSLDVTCQGEYSVVAMAATGNANTSRFSVSVENVSGSVAIDVPSTPEDWDAYAEVEGKGTLNLASGKNVIKVNFDESNINVDWIKFKSDNAQCPDAIPVTKDIRWDSFTGPVQYQVFDMNGHLLKSASVSAQGGVQALWQGVNAELPKGMYVLRYGKGSSMKSARVRK